MNGWYFFNGRASSSKDVDLCFLLLLGRSGEATPTVNPLLTVLCWIMKVTVQR